MYKQTKGMYKEELDMLLFLLSKAEVGLDLQDEAAYYKVEESIGIVCKYIRGLLNESNSNN